MYGFVFMCVRALFVFEMIGLIRLILLLLYLVF